MSKKKQHEPQMEDQEVAEQLLEEIVEASDESQNSVDEEVDPLVQLQEELKVQQDKYARLLAEFDNFKKRTAAEYVKMMESANKGLMLDVIEVRDVFERALESEHGDLVSFKEGMVLTSNKLNENLARHGLEVFGEVGDVFSPALHDAMMKQPSEEIPADHIAMVFEKGYKLKNNIIKHAKVIVSDGPAS